MRFPIYTALSIMLVAIFFFMYIMFNYAYHNPLSGAFTILDSQRHTMMDANYSVWAADLLNWNHSWWGTCFCILIIMVVVCGVVDAIKSSKTN
jgi:hypothetical protein